MPRRSAAATAALVMTTASWGCVPDIVWAMAMAISFPWKQYSDYISNGKMVGGNSARKENNPACECGPGCQWF
jgi:hypothetical protein